MFRALNADTSPADFSKAVRACSTPHSWRHAADLSCEPAFLVKGELPARGTRRDKRGTCPVLSRLLTAGLDGTGHPLYGCPTVPPGLNGMTSPARPTHRTVR